MKKIVMVVMACIAAVVMSGCTKKESRFIDRTIRDLDRLEQRKKDNERKDRYLKMAEENHKAKKR